MSPERILNKKYSYTSDIWSFGLVLIYLATGRYPYPKSESYIEMVQTILESPPPKLPAGYASFHGCNNPPAQRHNSVCVSFIPVSRDSSPNFLDLVSTKTQTIDFLLI